MGVSENTPHVALCVTLEAFECRQISCWVWKLKFPLESPAVSEGEKALESVKVLSSAQCHLLLVSSLCSERGRGRGNKERVLRTCCVLGTPRRAAATKTPTRAPGRPELPVCPWQPPAWRPVLRTSGCTSVRVRGGEDPADPGQPLLGRFLTKSLQGGRRRHIVQAKQAVLIHKT